MGFTWNYFILTKSCYSWGNTNYLVLPFLNYLSVIWSNSRHLPFADSSPLLRSRRRRPLNYLFLFTTFIDTTHSWSFEESLTTIGFVWGKAKMFQASWIKAICLHLLFAISTTAYDTSNPQYQTLPSLRQQAELKDSWTAERKTHIPKLLQKHGVGAWLVTNPPPTPMRGQNVIAKVVTRW